MRLLYILKWVREANEHGLSAYPESGEYIRGTNEAGTLGLLELHEGGWWLTQAGQEYIESNA